jgi:hypothetical protein
MPEILIASLPPAGHIAPLLNVAQGLVDRDDRVTVLTSAGARRQDPRGRRHSSRDTGGGRLRPDPPARTLEPAFARRDGVTEIAALVDEVIAECSAAVTQ